MYISNSNENRNIFDAKNTIFKLEGILIRPTISASAYLKSEEINNDVDRTEGCSICPSDIFKIESSKQYWLSDQLKVYRGNWLLFMKYWIIHNSYTFFQIINSSNFLFRNNMKYLFFILIALYQFYTISTLQQPSVYLVRSHLNIFLPIEKINI